MDEKNELMKTHKHLPIDFDDALAIAHEVKGVKKAVENLDVASTISIDNVDVKTDNEKIATDTTLTLISDILNNINDSIKAINVGDVATLYDLVSDLQDDVSQIENILKEDFDKISNIENRLDSDENNISEILVIINGVQDNLSAIVEQLTAMQSNMIEIVNDVESVKSNQEHVESDLTLLNNLYQTILNEVEELKEKIANIPDNISESLEDLEYKVTTVSRGLDQLVDSICPFTSISIPLETLAINANNSVNPYLECNISASLLEIKSNFYRAVSNGNSEFEDAINIYYENYLTVNYILNTLSFIFGDSWGNENFETKLKIKTYLASNNGNTTLAHLYAPLNLFSYDTCLYDLSSNFVSLETFINYINIISANKRYVYYNFVIMAEGGPISDTGQTTVNLPLRLYTNLEIMRGRF